MKVSLLVVLLAAMLCSVSDGLSLSFGRIFSGRGVLSNKSSQMPPSELVDLNIEANEVRKARLLTRENIRQIELDYDEKLESLDAQMEVLEKQQSALVHEQCYARFSKKCLYRYLDSGELNYSIEDPPDENESRSFRVALALVRGLFQEAYEEDTAEEELDEEELDEENNAEDNEDADAEDEDDTDDTDVTHDEDWRAFHAALSKYGFVCESYHYLDHNNALVVTLELLGEEEESGNGIRENAPPYND